MLGKTWNDHTPAKRCDFIDQLRGWAVIVMIEVHAVNVWLRHDLLPDWLRFVNGLVAPSFIMCAGYSLVLSTFKSDGGLRPIGPTAKRLAFILLCAYVLHAPSLTLSGWIFHTTPQGLRELFQIDVLQCIVFSLVILHGLARLIRRPMGYAAAALGVAVGVSLAAPYVWQMGVADGWWLPMRGLINGNADHGVASLFPLFPWLAFAASGSVLGAFYRHFRVMPQAGVARWSEARWLFSLAILGGALWVWGAHYANHWLAQQPFPPGDADRLYNMTLPSVAERLGIVCTAGATMGWIESIRSRWHGPNVILAASRESLLLYMLHLNLIFGLLSAACVQNTTGWLPHALDWPTTLTLTAGIIALNLAAAIAWQAIRERPALAWKIQKSALALLALWFLAAGWWPAV